MSTKSYIPARSGTERLFPGAVFQAITAVIDWSACAWDRRRQRKALALLDSRLLKDVGLSKDDVRQELNKPFWQ